MNLPLSSMPKTKIGTCPHGLPAGACQICSGMGGGGGSSKKLNKASGEMSWDECFAVGQMLKAQRLNQQQKNLAMEGKLNVPVNLTGKLENFAQKVSTLAEKLADFAQKIQSNSTNLPKPIAKILNMAAKIAISMALPILNTIKNIAVVIQNTINLVKEKLANITDKLNAVFGELKNSIEKKISDKLKDFKKKFKSIFSVFEPRDIEDEDKKIEEEIEAGRLFELKTAFQNIKEKLFTNKKEQIYGDS